MNPSEFVDILEGLYTRIKAKLAKHVNSRDERTNIRSVVGTWYQYRKYFVEILGDESLLHQLDNRFDNLLNLTATSTPRKKFLKEIRDAHRYFTGNVLIPLSRAYWSRVPERSPAKRDSEIVSRLKLLNPELANSYEQAIMDLEDERRISYRGSASELREVLTGVLHFLAPTEKVEQTEWYKESRRSGKQKDIGPTRAERTKFILRAKLKGSAATEAAEATLLSVEERLGNVVSATYRRGSVATHTGGERDELSQQLQYLNALLHELLPSP